MIVHQMRLDSDPFERIRDGKKRCELRLNDEKRRQIQVGDRIVFLRRSDFVDRVEVEVTSLACYPDFASMCGAEASGDPTLSKQDLLDRLHRHYSNEDVAAFGTLAIRFRLC